MSDSYLPNGDGTYAHRKPCATHGDVNAFLLFEDRAPECLACFIEAEAAEVDG